ncbi:MAG: DUF2914 domain-containing protein [Deltaproteobacteria bacterium]|nr:DUF2914 domain-containing protein [Deltaproteobacteria bacterium]
MKSISLVITTSLVALVFLSCQADEDSDALSADSGRSVSIPAATLNAWSETAIEPRVRQVITPTVVPADLEPLSPDSQDHPQDVPDSLPPSVESESATQTAPSIGEPQILETDGLELIELVVARGIEKRQPVGPGTSFEAGSFERIYAFMKVSNPSREASEVTVFWAPEGSDKERGKVNVSVGAQLRWRTWAYTRSVKKPGRYNVMVRNVDGDIIARAPFEIVAAE